MSKSQTLSELKETGVVLTQAEAQSIHTRISDIAKGLHESGELFEPIEHKEMGQANNVQASTGFEPNAPVVVTDDKPIEQKKLVAGNFRGAPGEKLKAEGYNIGDMYPRIEPVLDELIDHTVTQEDLDNNPELVANNVQVGDVIKYPKVEDPA